MAQKRTVLGISVLLSTILTTVAGCGSGTDDSEEIGNRFVEQVNSNTCDEASGFDIDDTTWTEACVATVADLASGTSLSETDMFTNSAGEVRTIYVVTSTYRNQLDVPTELQISFDGGGFFSAGATLTQISASASARIGGSDVRVYGRAAGDPIEPDAQAFIGDVEMLLANGRCDEVEGLMAPRSAFPGQTQSGECDAVAALYAAHSPSMSGDADWTSAVYSSDAIYGQDAAVDGIPRGAGESSRAYSDRVLDTIGRTNRAVSKWTQSPYAFIEAVLFEGQWYVHEVKIGVNDFRFEFSAP